jgi:hypothetical protein
MAAAASENLPGGEDGSMEAKPSTLLRCALFCRRLAPSDEDAELDELAEEILYFHPSKASVQDQLHFVNSCEGFIDFSRTFNSKEPIETVHLDHSRIVIHECEPETYLVLEVSTPIRPDEQGKKPSRRLTSFGRSKPAAPVYVAAADETHDSLLYDVASDMYDMYCLFRGPIIGSLFPRAEDGTELPAEENMLKKIQNARRDLRKALRYAAAHERGDLENMSEKQALLTKKLADGTLKANLDALMPQSPAKAVRHALQTLIPVVLESVNFNHLHLFHSLDGFNFLPVDKNLYVEVLSVVINLERIFPCVEGVGLLYQGHMVWNTLRHENMRLVLKFIRYHEMLGWKNKKLSARIGDVTGFLSNLRGVYANPEPLAGETSETEAGEAETGTKATLFNPPLCIRPINRDKKYVDQDEMLPPQTNGDLTDFIKNQRARMEADMVAVREGKKTMEELFTESLDEVMGKQEEEGSIPDGIKPRPIDPSIRGSKWRRRSLYREMQDEFGDEALMEESMHRTSQHRLVVYKQGPLTLVLTVNTTHKNITQQMEGMSGFCRGLKAYATEPLSKLGKMLGDGYDKIQKRLKRKGNVASKYQFIYFNRLNLALKVQLAGMTSGQQPSSLKTQSKNRLPDTMASFIPWPLSSAELCQTLSEMYSPTVVRAINETYAKLNEEFPPQEDLREIHIKTPRDGWVFGKKSMDRILIVLMNGRLNPIEAQEKVDELIDTVFHSIFI